MKRKKYQKPPVKAGDDLTVRETAAELRMCTRTIRRYISSGRLRAYRPGGTPTSEIRIPRASIEALRQAQ